DPGLDLRQGAGHDLDVEDGHELADDHACEAEQQGGPVDLWPGAGPGRRSGGGHRAAVGARPAVCIGRAAASAKLAPPRLFRSTLTSTDRPGRRAARDSPSSRMRTGTRWVILVKLPVAFSTGIRANSEPVAGAKLSMRPLRRRSGKASARISTSWPSRSRSTWVSLKFATT